MEHVLMKIGAKIKRIKLCEKKPKRSMENVLMKIGAKLKE
jgi:hypothetical protein